MQKLLITGLYRSGTTFLQTLIGSHPQILVSSQPFPNLYINLKKKYLLNQGIKFIYPIGDDFDTPYHLKTEFQLFLSKYKITHEDLKELEQSVRTYSGAWEPRLADQIGHIEPGNVNAVMDQLFLSLKNIHTDKQPSIVGSKEVLIEDYIPFLLQNNYKVIQIIRDIRDVITSLNFGSGKQYTGDIRPTLFNIRKWRKSVAYSLEHQHNPNFLLIKYENLILQPEEQLKKISAFLEVDNLFGSNIHDWKGNSSFDKLELFAQKPISRYQQFLSPQAIRFIETLAFPELKLMDYQTKVHEDELFESINNLSEPFEIGRAEFQQFLLEYPAHLEREKDRLKILKGDQFKDEVEVQKLFLFTKAFEQLRKVML